MLLPLPYTLLVFSGESTEAGTKFTDAGVCKSFLMGLCPFEQFHNTVTKKLDLGPCHKYHSLALKADFELASKEKDYGYDVDQLEHLTSFVKDCDRIVDVNKKRLEDNNDENDTSNEAMEVHTLNEKIGKLLADSETLGAEGNVEESLAMTKEVDELKAKKRQAEDDYRNSLPVTTTQQQKLRVCEICGAYLSLYDNDRRLADHFGGKLHMGFIRIRERLAELQESVAAKRETREKEREARRKERDDKLEKEQAESKDKGRDKEKERKKRRSRSREGSRRRDRSQDRDRRSNYRRRDDDRHRSRRRDNSKDRYKSRERSRDRSRERRRSRDRRRSSRDRRRSSRDRYSSRNGSRERSREKSRHRSRDRDDNRKDVDTSKITHNATEDGEIERATDAQSNHEEKKVAENDAPVNEEHAPVNEEQAPEPVEV